MSESREHVPRQNDGSDEEQHHDHNHEPQYRLRFSQLVENILHEVSHHLPTHENADGQETTEQRQFQGRVSFLLPKEEDQAVISHQGAHEEKHSSNREFKPKLRNDGQNKQTKRASPPVTASVTTLYKGPDPNLKDLVGEESTLSVPAGIVTAPSLDHLKTESRWDTAYHRLSQAIAKDERFQERKINVFGDEYSTDEDDESDAKRQASCVKKEKGLASVDMYSPFVYSQRPFRIPKLAQKKDPDKEKVEGREVEASGYGYQFEPVSLAAIDWSRLSHPRNLLGIIRKWNCPEPNPDGKPLPVDVDPLVQYRLRRLAADMEGHPEIPKPSKEEKSQTQKEIGVGITLSGRKLDGYSSDSGEEHVFKRVQCRHDPDFDLVQPTIDLGPKKGSWPNPYLYYSNWKRTDEDVDEHIKSCLRKSSRKREIAEELERDPMHLPIGKFGTYESDDSNQEDSKAPAVIDPKKPRSVLWTFSKVREPVTDPLLQRYPYLYRHLQGKYYNKYYLLKRMHQAHKRQWYALLQKSLGQYQSSFFRFTRYPLWYLLWKKFLRFGVKKIPRKWKFIKEHDTETLFYGTMASIYGTQYIVEYDLLPNMADPVLLSQTALAKAMEIKEQFLVHPPNGSKPYVDYLALQRSETYRTHLDFIGLLCRYQPIKMPSRVRKVFFLNYFNVLSIQTQICRIPELEDMKYLWEMGSYWEKTKGLAGWLELSLDDIYHGILRCNRPHPMKQVRVFREDQQKGIPKEMSPSRLILDWFDPRIHFAVNVGTKSCPPIMIFSLYEQDCQLEEVARTYIRSKVTIDEDSRTVTLPILFLWYEKDFGNNQRVLLWYLKRYLLPKDTLKIRRLVTSTNTIRFCYERLDQELEPRVIRHPASECHDEIQHKKIIPIYWGHQFCGMG